MTENNFLEKINFYLKKDISSILVSSYEEIDIYEFFDTEKLEEDNIYLDEYYSDNIIEAIHQEALRRLEETSSYDGESESFVLRRYLNLPSIKKEEQNFTYFNDLAEIYIKYQKKDRIKGLSWGEKNDMSSIFNKMLQLMLHFFTKTELNYLKGCFGSVNMDDFDSVIAMTLVKCLSLREKTAENIAEEIKIPDDIINKIIDCMGGVSLNYSLEDYLIAPKKQLIKKYINVHEIIPAYISKDNIAYYSEDDANKIIEDIYTYVSLISPETKTFKPKKTTGFNKKNKRNFGNYCSSAIKKELYKQYKLQLPCHVPARKTSDYIKEGVPKVYSLLTSEELEDMGINSSAAEYIQKQIVDASNVSHGYYEAEDYSVQESYERKELNKILLDKIRSIPNGNMVLYYQGIKYTNGKYEKHARHTYKETADFFGQKEYITKYAIEKCQKIFREEFPKFFEEYYS